MSLKEYMSKKDALLAKMQQASKPKKTKEDFADKRFWSPMSDKAGNKNAIIRFLPAPDTDVPWIEFPTYTFHEGMKKRWYINNCRFSLKDAEGKKLADPVYDLNRYDYDQGTETSMNNARRRKIQRYYISNILVVKDTIRPENDGKVFLYKYTQGIYDKIQNKIQGEFLKNDKGEIIRDSDGNPSEVISEPSNPFDYLDGSNFAVVYKIVDDKDASRGNYKDSKFVASSALYKGDTGKLEELHNQLYPLMPFFDESNFKSYADLKKQLMYVEGLDHWPLDEKSEADVKEEEAINKILEMDSNESKVSVPESEEISTDDFFASMSDDIEIDFD
jgi:hypothetical protein